MGSPRNLVLIGVFCCVYFVVMFSGGMLGIFSPVMIMVGGIISTLINGIVIMLYLAKVPQFGSLTILGLITGLGMMLTGHVWYVVPTAIITGLIGDAITRSGNYQENSPTLWRTPSSNSGPWHSSHPYLLTPTTISPTLKPK